MIYFVSLRDFCASRTQDTEATKSLPIKLLLLSSPPLLEQSTYIEHSVGHTWQEMLDSFTLTSLE